MDQQDDTRGAAQALRALPAGETDLAGLVARCGTGDETAFRQLYDQESPRLYGLALRLTRQPALAADAVHDAFIQIWQRSGSFDPARGSAEAWLSSLLRYRAIDILRRRIRDRDGTVDLENAVRAEEPDGFGRLGAAEETLALQHCLDQLEDAQRRVVMLAFIDGLTHSELADRLRAPLGTVKSWVRRALLSLRRCLEA